MSASASQDLTDITTEMIWSNAHKYHAIPGRQSQSGPHWSFGGSLFSHDFGVWQASRNKGLQSEQANVVDLFA
jgi:hypothetical protein